jgi:hypothetical protein
VTDVSSSPGEPESIAGTVTDTTVPHSARIWNYWLAHAGALLDFKQPAALMLMGINNSGAVPYYLRNPEGFARYFEGLELVSPGVVPMVQWRPDPDTEQAPIYSYCGVGHKP